MAGTIWAEHDGCDGRDVVSMESGLDGRNNRGTAAYLLAGDILSQWSPA